MINRKASCLALSLTALGVLFSSTVFADDMTSTATADMNVKLTVVKSCQVNVEDMDFGSHSSNDGSITATSQASVTCTNGTGYTMSTDATHDYEMQNTEGAEKVAYSLYGDKTGGSDLSKTSIPGVGTGTAQVIPLYGKVTGDALQAVSAGDYTDTVTFTVTY